MKFRSLLTILLFVPFVVMAQNKVNVAGSKEDATRNDVIATKADSSKIATTSGGTTYADTDPDDVVFYNTGEIYFGAKSGAMDSTGDNIIADGVEENQVMLVSGSMENKLKSVKAGTKPVVDGGVMQMAKNSAIAVTANIRNLYFTDGSEGSVWMVGGSTLHGEVAEFPSYSPTLVDYSGSTDMKKVKKKQLILNYNKVPSLVVGNYAYIALAVDQAGLEGTDKEKQNAAALVTTAQRGTVGVKNGGLFSVETKYSKEQARKMIIPTLAMNQRMVLDKNDGGKIGGQVLYDWELYNHGKTGENSEPGIKPGDPGYDGSSAGIGSNLVAGDDFKPAGSAMKKGVRKVLTPFVSPFKRLGADFFLFNVLTSPDGQAIGGGAEGPIVNPTTVLYAAKPYFTAMDVSEHDYDQIEKNNGNLKRNYRARGGYLFNRDYFMKSNSEKAKFNKASIDRIHETFVDVSTEYTFILRDGLNFLANPYLASLSFRDLVLSSDEGNEKTLTAWTSGVGEAPTVAKVNDANKTFIRGTVWFPENGSIQYFKENVSAKDFFKYNITYRDAKGDGGTWMDKDDQCLMPPLSVFALEVSKAQGTNEVVGFKIPNTAIVRDMLTDETGTIPNPITPRSSVKSNVESISDIIRHDEILLEAETVNLDGQNENANSVVDRLSVVLRPDATFASAATSGSGDDYIDNVKAMTVYKPGSTTANFMYGKKQAYDDSGLDVTVALAQELPGALYSISSDKFAMVTTAIPTTVRQLPVYYTPTYVRSKVTIRPYRLETLETVNQVWLVDHFDNDKVTELTPETEYTFISEPLSPELAKANRFTLVFGENPEDDDIDLEDDDKSLYCYYTTNTLHIENLIEEDEGSKVEIYDMQGRLMLGNGKITNSYRQDIVCPLASGAYIVRIIGNRNYTTKIMALP